MTWQRATERILSDRLSFLYSLAWICLTIAVLLPHLHQFVGFVLLICFNCMFLILALWGWIPPQCFCGNWCCFCVGLWPHVALVFLFFVRRYANLAGVFALRLACRCSCVCCCLFATVGSFLYSEDSFLRPCLAAFDCLSSFKDRASELYRPHFRKKTKGASRAVQRNK